MPRGKSQRSALSRLFSPSVFREMAEKGRSPLFARLFSQTGISKLDTAHETVATAFEAAFALLRRSAFRDEYVYRAALTHNILFGRHSLNTASILTEFRAGSCKADVVILNGTSTVYEIKSDRDSLTRLANQITNYRKVFAKIYVIAGVEHLQPILSCTPTEIGVLCLVRWNQIHTVREAATRPDLVSPVTIFDSLRLAEARKILRDLGVSIPDVPNTLLHGAMREKFARLEPAEVHEKMVQTLRRTRNLALLRPLVEQLPDSLKPAALAVQLRPAGHPRLLEAIRTPISEAIAWA